MALDVKVIINQAKPLTGAGFGIPLLFAGGRPDAVPYTECAGLEEVAVLFPSPSPVYKAASLLFAQDVPPSRVAVVGSTEAAVEALPDVWDREWRQLVVCTLGEQDESSLQEVATYVESRGDKVFFCSVADVSAVTGGAATLSGFTRTFCMVYESEGIVCPEAAVVGRIAGRAAGSLTYKNLILRALPPMVLTVAEIKAIHDVGCYTFVTKAGDNVTTEGKVGSGEFLDIVDAKDYIVQQIEYRTQKTLNAADKVSYDNNGIALLESVCVDVLQDAFNNGIVATTETGTPDFSVNYGPREETSPADREMRRYVLGRFSFALAGAIHEAVINGTIEI